VVERQSGILTTAPEKGRGLWGWWVEHETPSFC
jgi:hypothetical protein